MQRDPHRAARAAFLLVLALLLAGLSLATETVAYNVETRKYHCLNCRWAIACTKNCIEIPVTEAKKRGGVACKVCHGTCE